MIADQKTEAELRSERVLLESVKQLTDRVLRLVPSNADVYDAIHEELWTWAHQERTIEVTFTNRTQPGIQQSPARQPVTRRLDVQGSYPTSEVIHHAAKFGADNWSHGWDYFGVSVRLVSIKSNRSQH